MFSEGEFDENQNQPKETKVLLDILALSERQVEQGKVTRVTDDVQRIRKRCRRRESRASSYDYVKGARVQFRWLSYVTMIVVGL